MWVNFNVAKAWRPTESISMIVLPVSRGFLREGAPTSNFYAARAISLESNDPAFSFGYGAPTRTKMFTKQAIWEKPLRVILVNKRRRGGLVVRLVNAFNLGLVVNAVNTGALKFNLFRGSPVSSSFRSFRFSLPECHLMTRGSHADYAPPYLNFMS